MMFGKVTFIAVLMILFAMIFASLKGPRVANFVTNGSDNSNSLLRSNRPHRMRSSTGVASLGDSSAPDTGGAMPMAPQPATAPYAHRAPVATAPPQIAAPADSSDQQMNSDDNSNDNDSNDNDNNNDNSDDQNSNANDDNDNSGDQAMNNQGADEQSNNPFSQPVPPGMWRTPSGQLIPQINPPAIAPFPPRITNN
jgi:hypothetical protein